MSDKLTIRLGGMLVVGVAVLATLDAGALVPQL